MYPSYQIWDISDSPLFSANTALIYHHGKLLALQEADKPCKLCYIVQLLFSFFKYQIDCCWSNLMADLESFYSTYYNLYLTSHLENKWKIDRLNKSKFQFRSLTFLGAKHLFGTIEAKRSVQWHVISSHGLWLNWGFKSLIWLEYL